ncbi:helix-hairpin-helix domain-containing protein [Lentibacillus sediminis]|uniref:helix-hairpin-helix domain-containing protein n=1 Tax=Lentibacillus sediminis TaxID=1940529 RepID=UPI001EFE8F9B|nr:helix-hairpin-helix domain-containing protein [Lentibacillus sediminis]
MRKAKLKTGAIHQTDARLLAQLLHVEESRAIEIKGLAAFQQVPSIGHKLAEKLVYQLGFYSLDEIRQEDPGNLLNRLEQKLGVWTDPCVEDQIRCVIHYANNPDSKLQWFWFTEERKNYRARHGYPASRPEKAWYE